MRRVPAPSRREPPRPGGGADAVASGSASPVVPDGAPASLTRGLVRLVHPFPSLLDAVATGALALLAGGQPVTAAGLALSMLGIQFAIGAVNDLVDAPRDALARPTKPIPSGAVSVGWARLVALAAATVGLGLAAAHGPSTLAIASLGLGLGLAYDLVLKPTPLSWLPFALGIPLVPLFAWAGAAGTVPAPVLVLALLAVPAGAGVAVANALADVDDDRAAGTRTVATALGPGRAWWTATALLAGTWAAAVVALALLGGGPAILRAAGPGAAGPGAGTDRLAVVGWTAILASAVLVAVGAALGRGPAAARRRTGWGVEAIGVVTLGCGWVAVLEAADRLIA